MATLAQLKDRWTITARHRLKWYFGARPQLFFPLFRHRSAYDDLLVGKTTDICIEGVPRSANSFAVGAFEYAQDRWVEVAHHTHVPANPMRACEEDIPTLVLIRDPYDAIVSGVALRKQVQVAEKKIEVPIQLISFHDRLNAYLTFYQSLKPYRNQVVVAPFEIVIQDMGQVIERVNDRFGTTFDRFEHTPAAAAEIHARRGYHAGPSEQRSQLKEETCSDFDEQLQSDGTLQSKMEVATSLFHDFVDTVKEDDS